MQKHLLTIDEVAQLLSIGKTKAYELIRTGLIPSVRIGRSVRVPADRLADFVATLQQESGRSEPPQ
jgi:excisionase family DNA binding protein